MIFLNNRSRGNFTSGEIVNFVSIDAERCFQLMSNFTTAWSSPFILVLSFILLYNFFGWSMLVGPLIIIVIYPWFHMISKLSLKYIRAQTVFKDKRLNLTTGMLSGIKIIKSYAWENSLIQKVYKARTKELSYIRKVMLLNSTLRFSTAFLPFTISLLIFFSYVFFGKGHLTAEKTFASITIFNIMKFPIKEIPQFLNCIFYYKVSAKRVSKFLNCKDLKWLESELVSEANTVSKTSVLVEDGNFSWTDDEKPTLENVNLTIPQGKIVAVIGQVGSGKSSLLSAIIGEIKKLSGKVEVSGKIGYVAQQSWIQNQSLRKNILFGQRYKHEKYKTILKACSLETDIALLPALDLTEIGEKGINLSGGQKQRVSLARAVYDNADVYLLDDPLSAVDAHVGKHIFDHVIGPKGLLKSKVLNIFVDY